MAVTQKESQKKENNKENSEKNSSKHHEQLEIGANVKAQRADGSWHSANVVHRQAKLLNLMNIFCWWSVLPACHDYSIAKELCFLSKKATKT